MLIIVTVENQLSTVQHLIKNFKLEKDIFESY